MLVARRPRGRAWARTARWRAVGLGKRFSERAVAPGALGRRGMAWARTPAACRGVWSARVEYGEALSFLGRRLASTRRAPVGTGGGARVVSAVVRPRGPHPPRAPPPCRPTPDQARRVEARRRPGNDSGLPSLHTGQPHAPTHGSRWARPHQRTEAQRAPRANKQRRAPWQPSTGAQARNGGRGAAAPCAAHLVPGGAKYLGEVRAPRDAMEAGIWPSTCSIMARCSRFSCVWNSASPAVHTHVRTPRAATLTLSRPEGTHSSNRGPWPQRPRQQGILSCRCAAAAPVRTLAVTARARAALTGEQLDHDFPARLPPPNSGTSPEPPLTGEQLDHDAAHAPHVALEAPAQAQDHLGRAVVPRGHDAAVVLVLKRGAAKVNHLQAPARAIGTGLDAEQRRCEGKQTGSPSTTCTAGPRSGRRAARGRHGRRQAAPPLAP